jgi:hypothetical protein
MNPDRIARFFRSKIFIAIMVLIIGSAMLLKMAPMFIDARSYQDQVAQVIQQYTGLTPQIKGGVKLDFTPAPVVTVREIELKGEEHQEVQEPVVNIEALQFKISPLTLFSSTPEISMIKVYKPSLEVTQSHDGITRWGWLNSGLIKQLFGASSNISRVFILDGGRYLLHKSSGEDMWGVDNISLSGLIGPSGQIGGRMAMLGHPYNMSLARQADHLEFKLFADNDNSLTVKSDWKWGGELPEVKGNIEINLADGLEYLIPKRTEQKSQFDKIIKPTATEQRAAFPFKLNSDFNQTDGVITFRNAQLDAFSSKATGSGVYEFTGKDLDNVQADFAFDNFDVKSWRYLMMGLAGLDNKEPQPNVTVPNPFPKQMSIKLDATAKELTYGDQKWNSAILQATLSEQTATINKLNLNLPGDTSLGLFGIITTDGKGFRFQGNTEAQGKSLRQLLTIFDTSAGNLPEMGFGEFSLHSNISLSKELLRLSEASVKFAELNLNGGLVAYFDEKSRIEAEVKLKNINFDYFRDAWREKAKTNPQTDFFLKFNKDTNFDWLKKLATSIDFKVTVEGFTLLERQGSTANFRLFAQAGEFGIYNAKFNYDNDITEANIKLDVNGEQPSLNVVFNTSEVDSGYFDITPKPKEVVKPEPKKAVELPTDMGLPPATPEEELRQKMEEEKQMEQPDGEKTETPPTYDAEPGESAAPNLHEEKLKAPVAPIPDAGLAPQVPPEPVAVETRPQSLIVSESYAEQVKKGDERWPKELIDMSWMEGINGNFDISIGRLQYKTRLLSSFKMLAKLERNLLNFQTLTFAYNGGSYSINGTLFGGKVPGMSLGFVMASSNMQNILQEIFDVTVITGRTSMSGTIETSGINFLSWISQLKAKVLFAGKGVNIQGLDVAAVQGAVKVSRTAEDVFNSANRALVSGTGEYAAEGTINIEGGVLRSPGIGFRTGNITGTIGGELRLIEWDLKFTSQFQFPELTSDTVPTLSIEWAGDVNHPQIKTDTQSLEAYVSKRIIGN